MNNAEILIRYSEVINRDIDRYCKLYNITNKHEKLMFEEKYKTYFMRGFRKGMDDGELRGEAAGIKKCSVDIAINLIKAKVDLCMISKVTGFSKKQILSFKNRQFYLL